MSDTGGRYQRSTAGLVGALVVTLLVVAAYVAFRALNRNELEVKPEPVDYVPAVRSIEDNGGVVVHPAKLPDGWKVTSMEYTKGEVWSLGMLTGDQRFVGLRQAHVSPQKLVSTYVDQAADEGKRVSLHTPFATEWRSFTDEGGDYALVATLPRNVGGGAGGDTVIVYGSAPDSQIRGFAGALVAR